MGGFNWNHWKLVRLRGPSPVGAASVMFGIISLGAALTFCCLSADARQLTPDQYPAAAGQKENLLVGEMNIWIVCSTVLFFSPPTRKGHGTADGDGLPRSPPCLADDIFAVLRESLGESGELTDQSLTQFGICSHTDSKLEFLKETSKRNQLQMLHPSAGETVHVGRVQPLLSPHS